MLEFGVSFRGFISDARTLQTNIFFKMVAIYKLICRY